MTKVFTGENSLGFSYFERYNTPYRLVLSSPTNTVLNTYNDYFITTTPITLRTTETFTEYYTKYTGVMVDCDWDNATKILSCNYADIDDTITEFRFLVREARIIGSMTICNETSTLNSGVFICDLSAITNSTTGYYYQVVGVVLGSDYNQILAEGNIIRDSVIGYMGSSAPFLALMLVVTMGSLLGIWKPAVAVALSIAAVIFAVYLNMLLITEAMIGALLVVGALVIIKMRS